jgi:THO complex subunit 1 transcription elongation factor
MIEKVLDIFEKNPLCENNETDLIEKKYPKYLAKYKLINLQFNDFQFRETFMIQILILFQSLRQPINEKQTKFFKIPSKKKLNKIKNRILQIFNNISPQESKEKHEKEDCEHNSESSDEDDNKNTSGSELITRLAHHQNDSRLTKGVTQVLAADGYWVFTSFIIVISIEQLEAEQVQALRKEPI